MATEGYMILIGGDLSVEPTHIESMEGLERKNAELVIRRCVGGRVAEEEIRTRSTDQLVALADEIVKHRAILREGRR